MERGLGNVVLVINVFHRGPYRSPSPRVPLASRGVRTAVLPREHIALCDFPEGEDPLPLYLSLPLSLSLSLSLGPPMNMSEHVHNLVSLYENAAYGFFPFMLDLHDNETYLYHYL